MPAISIVQTFFLYCLMLITLGLPLQVRAQEKPGSEKIVSPAASPDALPRVLAEGAVVLEKETAALKPREEAASQALTQSNKSFRDLEARVAALRASLALKKLPMGEVEEAVVSLGREEERLAAQLKDAAREIETLTRDQEAKAASQAALQTEVANLKAAKHPVARSRDMQQSLQRYQKWAAAQKQGAAQVLGQLQKSREVLEKGQQLASGLLGDLKKYADETWKTELLKRQEHVPLTEQAARLGQVLAALPGQALSWGTDLVSSGRLGTFLKARAAQLLGLTALLILMFWGAQRLSRLAAPWLAARQGIESLGSRFLLTLGQTLAHHLFLVAWFFWLWVGAGTMGILTIPGAQSALYLAGVLIVLRLALGVVRAAFAVKQVQGLLALDDATARFYRRSLQFFLIYLALGLLGLTGAELLGLPLTIRQFLGYLFGVGLLGWALWLLRRPYLTKLIPELPLPGFIGRLGLLRIIRGLVLLVLGAVILADLLGFQNLSIYVAQAAALTGGGLILLGILWLVSGWLLHRLLHPEAGWASRRYPGQAEALQRLYAFTRRTLLALLAVSVLLGLMKAWGVKPERLAWAFQWLTWGLDLGPIRLTPLTLGGAALALVFTFWLSRLLRRLMEARVYPRAGWDQGIRYTISTTLHYGILILGGLIALNILGFPLTNLALVAGALGVGIGFGLQNIVNNFISGLILLFERPIKVGDILVIDGQWGKVKEIRVRSTIFQTADRAVLIIPNSEMLSHKIINWTHHGWGPVRLTLEVGVGYGSDVEKVTRLLLDAARANPKVLDKPPPQVFFKAFGDSSLNFVIQAHIQSPEPRERLAVTHELNRAILETCAAHGIELPSPQRDLYIKNWPAADGRGQGA